MKSTALVTPLLLALLVGGCAPAPLVVLGAAGGTATVATDRRSAGRILDDQAAELRILAAIGNDDALRENTKIAVTSYNGVALLTGEAVTESHAKRAADLARRDHGVRHVHNEVAIAPLGGLGSLSGDAWITTKVKTKMYDNEDLEGSKVKVVTENGIVYLMGLVSRVEANLATAIASDTSGVQRVVRIFEYTD